MGNKNEQDAKQACLRFLLIKYKNLSNENKVLILSANKENDTNKINECLKVQTRINEMISDLTTELGMVVI